MSDNTLEVSTTKSSILLTPPFLGPEPGKRFTWNQCIGSSDAGIIAQHAADYRQQYSIMVVICGEPTVAQRLAQEIPLFNPDLRVSLLPDWEILPYDQFSPHHDLISERLKTINFCHSTLSTSRIFSGKYFFLSTRIKY